MRHGHGSTGTARLARHQWAQGRTVRAPSSHSNREGNAVTGIAGSREGALKGLSRMKGNFHVRFLGGRVDGQPSCGPATAPAYPARTVGSARGSNGSVTP